jgi:hypothetical protein
MLLIPFTCSCQPFYEAVAEGVAEGLAEVIAEAIVSKWLNEMMILSLTIEAYHQQNDTWPKDQNDICTFCNNKNWEYPAHYWATCKNVKFVVQDDDSIEISFTRSANDSEGNPVEYPVSLKMQKSNDCDEDIDQRMARILEERENINKALQPKH